MCFIFFTVLENAIVIVRYLTIIRLINGQGNNLRLHHYIEAIKSWKTMFSEVSFTFRHREANQCADMLAKQALLCNTQWSLYHTCPRFLQHTVINDCNFDN
ncbi:uncharacterized protein LOC112086713 [Eutrema salsugineum]|uniref:uncharacterized protein LOC112086713 n=1 Tax=Eutrema salsugineum TaxID=72664 RepID=UPI000CED5776|nr:uncharacterized protein LOC112086713 [Eutrema salsugineum]